MLKQYLDRVKKRKECNTAMLDILKELVENHPQLRFGQILVVFGFVDCVTSNTDGAHIVDPFNEESADTLARVKKTIKELKKGSEDAK